MGDRVNWRFVNATSIGTSHVRSGLPCQDDCFSDVLSTEGGDVLVAIASDGAGSAICAEEGAGLTCATLNEVIEHWLAAGGKPEEITRELVAEWIAGVRAAIESRAAGKQLSMRDFACTVVAAVVQETAAAFLQIGDGAIICGLADSYDVVFWPDGGEYVNTDSDGNR